MGVGGYRHALSTLPQGKRPGTHCTGGWVGPRAGLVRCGKYCLHRNSIPGPSILYQVAELSPRPYVTLMIAMCWILEYVVRINMEFYPPLCYVTPLQSKYSPLTLTSQISSLYISLRIRNHFHCTVFCLPTMFWPRSELGTNIMLFVL
jgi:hypothetical protein